MVHVYNPDTRLYVGFESRFSEEALRFATYYRFGEDRSDRLIEDMKNPNWDKNIGLSVEELKLKTQQLKEIRINKGQKKEMEDLYTDYYPTVDPTAKLSNKQIQQIPEILQDYLDNKPLSPKEMAALTRYQRLNQGWQDHLNQNNVDLNDFRRNLWHNNQDVNVDPSQAPLLNDQITEIVGPTLGDID